MKVAFEGQAFSSAAKTGVGWYTFNIIKAIIAQGIEHEYEINIFDFLRRNKSNDRVSEQFLNDNVKLKQFNLLPYGIYARYQELFTHISYNTIFSSKPDICHFFNFILPRNIKSKTVNTIHDLTFIRYPETMSKVNYNIHKKELKRSCKDADIIMTISQNSKNEIIEFMGVPENKIHIATPAVDENKFYYDADFNYIKDRFKIKREYLLYLGTLEPRKNVLAIIKAFNIFAQSNKDIDLVLAGGKGWLIDDVFKLIEEYKLTERVIFTGYVTNDESRILYSCAKTFLFPSLYEGFGIPPLEAMACGTPVIVSDAASLPEVVGDAGIIVKVNDVEGLAFEMERLATDEIHRANLSEKGIAQSKTFRWENSAKKVLEVYKLLE